MKPVVGVVCARKKFCRPYIQSNYIKALEDSGASARLLPWVQKEEDARGELSCCSALLLPGGCDISPELYNERKRESCGKTNAKRDAAESLYFKEAAARGLPILGICRGIQMINVLCGGTLWQDIKEMPGNHINHRDVRKKKSAAHSVEISPGTLLFGICGGSLQVNSMHHQALKDMAQALICSAVSPDGIVEAAEAKEGFILGVQWHPERLYVKDGNSAKIFKAFIEAASVRADTTY